MKIVRASIPEVLLITPTLVQDARGSFFESFRENVLAREAGQPVHFVQENYSYSLRHVLRGLHYQIEQPQAKLVQVISGTVFDVAVDVRRSSPTFGQWVGYELSAESHNAVWIPAGFAHGFVCLSDGAAILYKVTDYWAPQHERRIRWNDAELAIGWPLQAEPLLSPQDAAAPAFRDADLFP